MAAISITYTSATSYTVSATGLTVGQKYHIFTEDLNTSGSVTGYVCRYTQTATSSSWSGSYTCGSAYSGFTRHAYLYCTGTTATSHSVGSTYSAGDLPSASGGMWSAYDSWGGGTGDSYRIRLKRGSGISSISFRINGTSGTTYTVGSGSEYSEKEVGSGGYLYLTDVGYESGYSCPVIATDQTSTPYRSWTAIDEDGAWSDHYVSAPASAGTRIVNLSATLLSATYYYRIKAHANGGTFDASGAETWNSAVYSSDDSYVTYDLSGIPSLSRPGYALKGWAGSESATNVYDDSVSFTATSTSDNSPTFKEVWAVWEKETYSGYIKLGEGINSANVYADGALKATITDKAYHELLDLTTGTVISIKGIGKAGGYTRPYTFKFYTTSTATTTTNTLEVDSDEPEYSWMRARVYAEIVAKKTGIEPFYWDSASTDAALIAKGQPVTNLTAARWNSLLAKIREVAEATGGSFSYSAVSSGGTFYASEFNEARAGILALTGHGTLPGTKAGGDDVLASLFEGSGSLKAALNTAITNFNNS